jgi:membrane protease YdiL (CAAX protease family)
MFMILVIGIPSWRESIRDIMNYINPASISLIFIIFPYIILLISGGTNLDSIIEVLIWYLVPTLLFLLPEIIETKVEIEKFTKFRIAFNVVGSVLLWIGFDHRYTSRLFSGFDGVSYTMNAIWMACIMMVTFGRYIGVENPNIEYDKGIAPTKYGTKIANIATPIASFIIIPFGIITGFLIWNPQELNILVIIVTFLGIYLTIALQEEMVFRGIIQNELTNLEFVKSNRYIKYSVIILVTIAFALTHWNNEVQGYVYHYFIAAFIAGLAYAISYKKGGLYASMLAHTLVDWVWALLLKRT